MPANNLRITSSEDLRTFSKTFGSLSQQLAQIYKSISQNVTNLESTWNGEAATKFSQNIQSTYTTFDSAVKYLEAVSKDLNTAANNYDEVERANQGTST